MVVTRYAFIATAMAVLGFQELSMVTGGYIASARVETNASKPGLISQTLALRRCNQMKRLRPVCAKLSTLAFYHPATIRHWRPCAAVAQKVEMSTTGMIEPTHDVVLPISRLWPYSLSLERVKIISTNFTKKADFESVAQRRR